MVYVGSKNRYAKYIVPILQKCIDDNKINTYIEPFVGGGNVIDKITCPNRIGSDNNKYLIALMQNLNNVKELIEMELETPEIRINLNDYQYIKEHKEEYEDWFVGYIGFISSFGGKFFNGFSQNAERDYYKERAKNLYKQIPSLKGIKFVLQDYSKVQANNCVIYCDPPYANYKTSKVYNKNFDTEKFFNWCREQSKYNHVFVSESVLPNDFEIVWEYKNTTSGLSLTKQKTSKPELLGYMCNM